MTVRADLGLETLFCTNSCTLLKKAKTCCTQCENEKTCWSWAENPVLDKLVHPLGKWCTGQCEIKKTCSTRAEDAVLHKLVHFAENCKKWCTQCENDKTCWSRSENAVLYKLVHFAVNAKKWCAQCKNDKTCCSRAENAALLFWTNSCTSLKSVKKWCNQGKYDKTWWSLSENAVLYKLVHFAENRQKVVRPMRKWQNVLISGSKLLFRKKSCTLLKMQQSGVVQTRALCSKALKSGTPSLKMEKRGDLGLNILFFK